MKKIFSFVIVLGILFFVFQFGITLLKKGHVIDYKINIDNKEILINEKYIKKASDNYYLFKVNIEENTFVFDVNNEFNKQKKVIDNFKIYEQDDLFCISPIYIKNSDESTVICNLNGQPTSYTTVKDSYDLDEFLNSLDNFNFDKYVSFDSTSVIGKSDVYNDNMYEDEVLIVYDYKDLIKITKSNRERIGFSNYDIYHNETGILIGEYYILPIFENKPEYSGVQIINIEDGKKEQIKFEDEISTNIYINGVVDDKLYFFDKSNLVQYEIDPNKKTYRVVGDKNTNGQYYDGRWATRNIYDFYKQELMFTNTFPIKGDYVNAYETSKYYYYYDSNNKFYKVYKQELDNPIFLFQYDDIKEVKVVNDSIYFIHLDTIYRFDETGIKKIVTNNEFKYNYENIYSAYFK